MVLAAFESSMPPRDISAIVSVHGKLKRCGNVAIFDCWQLLNLSSTPELSFPPPRLTLSLKLETLHFRHARAEVGIQSLAGSKHRGRGHSSGRRIDCVDGQQW
jgi:hypothetical protein